MNAPSQLKQQRVIDKIVEKIITSIASGESPIAKALQAKYSEQERGSN